MCPECVDVVMAGIFPIGDELRKFGTWGGLAPDARRPMRGVASPAGNPPSENESLSAQAPSDFTAFKIASGVHGASNLGWPPGLTAWTASRIAE